MTLHLPSASAQDRAFHCDASMVLPRVHESGDWAEYGTGGHDFIVAALEKGREAALDDVPMDAPHRRLCEFMPLDSMPQGGRREVAFAYNPATDTARVLGVNIGRDYIKAGLIPGEEYAGTADLVGTMGGMVVIVDWKMGWKYLGDPKLSRQLRLLALAACRVYGLDQARVSFWYQKDDGSYSEEVAEFTSWDLDEIRDELRDLAARAHRAKDIIDVGGMPRVSAGVWCDYCPCVDSCPAKVALARAMVTEPTLIEERIAALTPEQAAQAWLRIKEFKVIADRVEAGLRRYAKVVPFPIGGGKWLRETAWPETVIKPSVAFKVISDMHGADVAEAAVPRKVTQKGIEEALRPVVLSQKLKLAPTQRAVIKAISDAGGLVVIRTPQVREGKEESK